MCAEVGSPFQCGSKNHFIGGFVVIIVVTAQTMAHFTATCLRSILCLDLKVLSSVCLGVNDRWKDALRERCHVKGAKHRD